MNAVVDSGRKLADCAITLAFLRELSNEMDKKWTASDVVTNIIIPATKEKKCRFADLMMDKNVGSAQWFISYRWETNFRDLVSAIDRAVRIEAGMDPDNTRVWIDIFAVNQHASTAQQPDLQEVGGVIDQASRTLLVLDTSGSALTRLWCLWEVGRALLGGSGEPARLRVGLPPLEASLIEDLYVNIDAARAKTSEEVDRTRLLRDIKAAAGGLAGHTRSIKQGLVAAVQQEVVLLSKVKEQQLHPYIDSLHKCAVLEQLAGQYGEAEKHYREALELYMGSQDGKPGDLVEATVLINNLAVLLRLTGRFQESEQLSRTAVDMLTKVHGAEHVATAAAVAQLAVLLRDVGRLAEAEPLFMKALVAKRAMLGPRHHDCAATLNDLAVLYINQGRHPEAQELLDLALDICERSLGHNHPRTVKVVERLALCFKAMGKLEKAEPLFKRVLDTRTSVLGAGHSQTAAVMAHLAQLYAAHSRLEEAQVLFEGALAVQQSTLGPEHMETATTLNSMGLLLQAKGAREEARGLFMRALNIRKKVLGESHFQVGALYNNLAMLAESMGDLGEAEATFNKAMTILVPHDPLHEGGDTEGGAPSSQGSGAQQSKLARSVMLNYAGLLQQLGRLEEAQVLVDHANRAFPTPSSSGANPAFNRNNSSLIDRTAAQQELVARALERGRSKSSNGIGASPLSQGSSGGGGPAVAPPAEQPQQPLQPADEAAPDPGSVVPEQQPDPAPLASKKSGDLGMHTNSLPPIKTRPSNSGAGEVAVTSPSASAGSLAALGPLPGIKPVKATKPVAA